MTIDWQAFTPVSALGGGALIGLATAVLLLFCGRIAGISGILGGLLRPRAGDTGWRLAFTAGLALAPWLFGWLAAPAVPHFGGSTAVLIGAGLLVGFGTRLGSGCTSGHGVCGVARLAPRSLAATAIFMAAGIATVYVVRHGLGG